MLPSVNHNISRKPTTAAITVYLFSISNRVPPRWGCPQRPIGPGLSRWIAMQVQRPRSLPQATRATFGHWVRPGRLGRIVESGSTRTSTNFYETATYDRILQLPSLVLHQFRATVVFAERVPIGTVSYDSV
jgi:hypothetical protein